MKGLRYPEGEVGVNISTFAAMAPAAKAREFTGPEFTQCPVTEDIFTNLRLLMKIYEDNYEEECTTSGILMTRRNKFTASGQQLSIKELFIEAVHGLSAWHSLLRWV